MSNVDKLLDVYDRKSKTAFTLEAGESAIVHLLPPYDPSYEKIAEDAGARMDPHTGILICRTHSFLPRLPLEKGEGKDYYYSTNWRCLQDFHKPCPFCAFFDSLDRKKDWEIVGKHGCRPRPMVDLYLKEDGICKRWYMTQKRTLERFRDLFDTLPELNDPAKGRWLSIKRVGADKSTEYHIKVLDLKTKSGKPLPFTLPEDQYPDDITSELNNMPIIPGSKSAAKVLQAQFPEMF